MCKLCETALFYWSLMLPKLIAPRTEIRGQRMYTTPQGRYPSITTILSATRDKSFLERWKKRIGATEAERIRSSAAARGTSLHSMVEAYLLNGTKGSGPWWDSIQDFLSGITNVHLIEGPLWHEIGFAGTVDLLADWQGVTTVIDWKTARSVRRTAWVEDYKLQTIGYGGAANKLYKDHNFKVQRAHVVVALEDQPAQVFHIEYPELVIGWRRLGGRIADYHKRMTEWSSELFGEKPDATE